MRERTEMLLRLGCVALGALLVFQLARLVARRDPLGNLSIPALPTLASAERQTGAKETKAPPQPGAASTKHVTGTSAAGQTTNLVVKADTKGSTNFPAVLLETPETNAVAKTPSVKAVPGQTPKAASNAVARSDGAATNSVPAPVKGASNVLARAGESQASTNSNRGTNTLARSSGPPARPGLAKKGLDAPPEILARVDRITESELLGPVIRPLPMALLGIAGDTAFLRSPMGQTGLAKEGEEVGGLKVLRIGINRVLVEKDGQTNELMIFNGLGGDSLLSTNKKPEP